MASLANTLSPFAETRSRHSHHSRLQAMRVNFHENPVEDRSNEWGYLDYHPAEIKRPVATTRSTAQQKLSTIDADIVLEEYAGRNNGHWPDVRYRVFHNAFRWLQ